MKKNLICPIQVQQIAEMCHQVNKAYCEAIGDTSQLDWAHAPNWQQDSAVKGVEAHIESELKMTPEGSHISWMKEKLADGWTYGPIKDSVKKEHPCLIDYRELPTSQRVKDHLFREIVHTSCRLILGATR